MTNQNNELRVILEDFAEDLAEIPEGSKLEDIYDLVKSAHQTAEKAIQALYAPKPVENGELDTLFAEIATSYDNETIWQVCTKVKVYLAQEKAKWVAELESTVIGAKPDRLQPLDLGELGGEDGRTGLSAVVVASVQLYNQAVKDYETNLRKALAKLLDKENI